jgi:kynureninase
MVTANRFPPTSVFSQRVRSSSSTDDAREQSRDHNRSHPRDRDPDERWSDFQQAMRVLRARIFGNGASDLVVADLLEDDLRQARLALSALSEFLDDTLSIVGDAESRPSQFVAVADTAEALQAVDRLAELLPAVRRRLGQVALRLAKRG